MQIRIDLEKQTRLVSAAVRTWHHAKPVRDKRKPGNPVVGYFITDPDALRALEAALSSFWHSPDEPKGT